MFTLRQKKRFNVAQVLQSVGAFILLVAVGITLGHYFDFSTVENYLPSGGLGMDGMTPVKDGVLTAQGATWLSLEISIIVLFIGLGLFLFGFLIELNLRSQLRRDGFSWKEFLITEAEDDIEQLRRDIAEDDQLSLKSRIRRGLARAPAPEVQVAPVEGQP